MQGCKPSTQYAAITEKLNTKSRFATNAVKIIVHIKIKIMNCPYCNKQINALTGLMELQKFKKHLNRCKKNPDRVIVVSKKGNIMNGTKTTLMDALNIRAESGQ
jgi:hypothetical protein